jgi:hypothetical protein
MAHRHNLMIARGVLTYAAPASPELLFTDVGGAPWAHDLSTTPLSDTPIKPGSVSIAVTTILNGAQVITDDGAGNLTNALALAAPGTIDYATGAMTGVTIAADLVALSTVIATYDLTTKTLEVPRGQLRSVDDITAWIFPTAQAVTASWRLRGVRGDDAEAAERTGPINDAAVTAIACPAGEWTSMHLALGKVLVLGELLVDCLAGGTIPTDVHVQVMGAKE